MRAVLTTVGLLVSLGCFAQQGNSSRWLEESHKQFLKKKYSGALALADSARQFYLLEGNADSLESVYRWLAKIHLTNKDYDQSEEAHRQVLVYRDSIHARQRRLMEKQLEQQWKSILLTEQVQRKEDVRLHEQAILELERSAEDKWRNTVIVLSSMLVLTLLGILALVRNQLRARAGLAEAQVRENQQRSYRERLNGVLSVDLIKSLGSLENLSRSLAQQLTTFSQQESVQLLRQLQATTGETKNFLKNVLDWIAYQANARSFQPEEFDAGQLTAFVLGKFQSLMRDKQLTGQVFIPPSQSVFGDRDSVEIILENLIINAIQFTPPGGAITCFSGNKDGLVMIGIKDTGVGIHAEQLTHLFEGATKTVHDPHKGGGIGLLLAHHLVERNGGRIYAESQPGHGSTFYFTLPEKKNV